VVAQTYLGAVVPDYATVGTADYTGDGRADVLWRHQTSGELWLWQMNGATIEAVTRVATIDPSFAVVASGDLNADGRADLLWRHQTSGDVWVWLMNGAVATSQVYLEPSQTSGITWWGWRTTTAMVGPTCSGTT